MEQIICRPAMGDADFPAIIRLMCACRSSALPYYWPPGYEMRRQLCGATASDMTETRLWTDRANRPVAFGSIWDASLLVFGIQPGAEHYEELLLQILAWSQARVRELSRIHGELALVCVPLHAGDSATAAVLERQGFVPTVWQQLRMQYSLAAPIPVPQLPDGFTLQAGVRAADLDRYAALCRAVGLADKETATDHLARQSDPAYRLDLELLAVAADGELAALCLGLIDDQGCGPNHRREGWVDLIGTRHAYRRQGLARALLLNLLQRLQAHAVNTVWLSTDGENLSAQHLFGSVGFHVAYRVRWYIHELQD